MHKNTNCARRHAKSYTSEHKHAHTYMKKSINKHLVYTQIHVFTVYICKYIYLDVNICVYIYRRRQMDEYNVQVCTNIRMCVHLYTYIGVCTCTCNVCTCTYKSMQAESHTHN